MFVGSKKRSAVWAPWVWVWYFRLSGVLALVLAALVCGVALRVNPSVELSFGGRRGVSARLGDVLAETQGSLRASCFLASGDVRFRAAARLVRGIQAESRRVAGARVEVAFVDPRRDIAEAVRLMRLGAEPGSIVFELGRRHVVVPLENRERTRTEDVLAVGRVGHSEFFQNESACVSAVLRLLRSGNVDVYWLSGHGEFLPDDFDVWNGGSVFADVLRRHGFGVRVLDLAAERGVPEGCDVLVVAGPRSGFAVEEREWLERFLSRGGRLLYFVNPATPAGVEGFLAAWGVRVSGMLVSSSQTLSGAEIVVRNLPAHEITRGLSGLSLLFGQSCALDLPASGVKGSVEALSVKPVALSDDGARGAGSDRLGPFVLAAAVERGGDLASGLAYRPARLVVVGNAACVSNGMLRHRAAANVDFLLNAMNWLAGFEVGHGSAAEQDVVMLLNFTRSQWLRYMGVSTVGLVAAFLAVRMLVLGRRG